MSNTSIDSLCSELALMRRGGTLDDPKPHKLLMLLSVLDLLDSGELRENRIVFNEHLVRRFVANFRSYAGADDHCQPGPPFFHLRNSTFWHHQVKPGREEAYSKVKRVGGSTQLITDNIEYAHLNNDLFALLQQSEHRALLRGRIVQILEQERGSRRGESERLSLAFHESFPLSRPAIASLLRVRSATAAEGDVGKLFRDAIREQTCLGPNYIRAMPRWAVGSGLLDANYRFTALGDAVSRNDPDLARAETLWAMHYHLAAPTGPGPAFWHALVSATLKTGDTVETSQIAAAIEEFLQKTKSKPLAARTFSDAATVFLGTYHRSDALGSLGVLEQAEAGRYEVKEPSQPALWVFAYVLAEYWQANWAEMVGVSISRLSEPGGLASLLLMGSGSVNRYLGELQSAGFAVVQRRVPPFQINRNWSSPVQFLEKLYDD